MLWSPPKAQHESVASGTYFVQYALDTVSCCGTAAAQHQHGLLARENMLAIRLKLVRRFSAATTAGSHSSR